MKFSRRRIFYWLIICILLFLTITYPLPFYIYKPGHADALGEMVTVENGFVSKGDIHLVTVSSGKATPIQYILAKVLPHQEIISPEEARPEGITDDEYMHMQLQFMESSQESSIVVAYEAANEEITVTPNGVFVVGVVEGMPAKGKLKIGDHIKSVDGHPITVAEDLIEYVEKKAPAETIVLDIVRDDEPMSITIELAPFEGNEEKVGVGIQLVTDQSVEVDREVNFASGNIGGPSAGLMFALEIYDQLTEEDLTKGLRIAGTGEIDFNGNVKRIGGIDKKVVAADREGCDIFFAPNEDGRIGSNYEEARKKAEEIDTDMKVVPVDTFDDALNYLQNISEN